MVESPPFIWVIFGEIEKTEYNFGGGRQRGALNFSLSPLSLSLSLPLFIDVCLFRACL